MKVLVLTTRVPFVHGGAEELRDHLVANLERAGLEAEAMSLPFSWSPAEHVVDEMAMARSIEVVNADRVIALKFPAYQIPHANKVIWLVHQFRQAYDLYDAGYPDIPRTPRGEEIRSLIRRGDENAFAQARGLYAISPVIRDRLRKYHDLEAPVLPCPLNDPERFTGGASESYLFAGGRVGGAKRQALIVEALACARGVRLVIAGPPDTPDEADSLRELAARVGVEDRLTLDIRFLPRSEYARLVNEAAAVVYIPFEEDSVGYVTLEAFQAGKPVLTTSDAGGVLEIVHDGETGIVAKPTARSLGSAMRRIVSRRTRAMSMGQAGRELIKERALSWPSTIERLMS